jgi:NADPH-dependent curcumin reductase CurA
LGLLGITGFTAYVGLFKIGGLREGMDTVFVSAAAGGVGSIACQIVKIKACHVVGSAGTEDKVKWLLDDVKIDFAFNDKKLGESIDIHSNITKYNNDISSELKRACPNGIDLYFDNVGGKHLEAAIDNMSLFGRIVLCGATSVYDSVATTPNSSLPSGPSNLSAAGIRL